ncbi:MAG: Veg family protein [Clostridia bacterium]|nr:Veg family protein [Clostridia bacterium]
MIKTTETLSKVKDAIKKLEGKDVLVTLNVGRNKYVKFFGVLNGVYSSLFTVKPEEKDFFHKTAYSYSEYVCGKVKLTEK